MMIERLPGPSPDELDSSPYVVLRMVRRGARAGYEIKRRVDLSIRFFWTISPARVYPSLERLEEAGLLRGRSEPQGRRPRRVYELTGAGESALARWVGERGPIPFEL